MNFDRKCEGGIIRIDYFEDRDNYTIKISSTKQFLKEQKLTVKWIMRSNQLKVEDWMHSSTVRPLLWQYDRSALSTAAKTYEARNSSDVGSNLWNNTNTGEISFETRTVSLVR